jgi:4'-phosphopantetheinyl transferase
MPTIRTSEPAASFAEILYRRVMKIPCNALVTSGADASGLELQPGPVTMSRMNPHEVHVRYVFSDRTTDPELLARYEALLSPDEKARRERFLQAKDRHQHLIARALVRCTLSQYADVPPEAWTFAANRYGRPEISGPIKTGLEFNLSHTRGLVVIAVAWDREIGVDVENVEREGDYVHLAQRFFAPSEAAHVASLPAEQQKEMFFDYWTLKESYIKARGMGLALPLEQFAFRLDEPATISFSNSLQDDASSWLFRRLRLSEHHKAALAVRCGKVELEIEVRETTPFKSG